MRGGVPNRLSPEPLDTYYTVVPWGAVSLLLVLYCILGLYSQIIDFINSFARANIPTGGEVFIEISRYFKRNVGKCEVVLIMKKIVYDQAKVPQLCYEKLLNGL